MFWSKDDIVERLSEIPGTLEDISMEVFESVPPTSDFLYRASIEKELTYTYMDISLSNEYVIHSSQYQFMLLYEIIGFDIKKEYRIFQPDELKAKFPMAYKQLIENESEFGNEIEKFDSADCYRLENESFLHQRLFLRFGVVNRDKAGVNYVLKC